MTIIYDYNNNRQLHDERLILLKLIINELSGSF